MSLCVSHQFDPLGTLIIVDACFDGEVDYYQEDIFLLSHEGCAAPSEKSVSDS